MLQFSAFTKPVCACPGTRDMHEKKKSETQHYSFTLFIGTFGFEDS